MQAIIVDIVALLTKEKDLYSSMLELSIQKKDIILQGKVSELDRIVTAEQALLMKIGEVERQRHKKVSELATIIGELPDSLKISEIYALADDTVKVQLSDVRNEFAKILEKQIEYNDINKKLIEQNLEYIENMLDYATQTKSKSQTYGAGGHQLNQRPRSTNIIDQKV